MTSTRTSLVLIASVALGALPVWGAEQPPTSSAKPTGVLPHAPLPVTAGPCLEYSGQGQQPPGNKIVVAEAEKLATAGYMKYSTSGIPFAVQDMAGFGPGWGGQAQVFWGGGLNAELVMDFEAKLESGGGYALTGIYEVSVYLTRAPDYGQVRVVVKGWEDDMWQKVGVFDTWAEVVRPPSFATPKSTLHLNQGKGSVHLKIMGKNAKSTGYFSGIDCIGVRYIKKQW